MATSLTLKVLYLIPTLPSQNSEKFRSSRSADYHYEGCPENIRPFWISQELVMWPWCNLAASQRWPYCTSINSHSPVGLVSQQWDALTELVYCVTVTFTVTEQADQLHHNNAPAHSTALVQASFGKASHHPGLSALLQPRFGSLQLRTFPKAKITVEREEICECDGHTLHKFSQWRLTADW